jgi:hypothetical protein
VVGEEKAEVEMSGFELVKRRRTRAEKGPQIQNDVE